jgi:hypothetical protein
MKIIKHREYHPHTIRQMVFGDFAFDCDENGVVDVAAMPPEARANYERCKAQGPGRYHEHLWTSKIPAVGLCDYCDAEVELSGFTNTCECGADYNSSGQALAPREQWGEETGESLADILSVDRTSTEELLDD